MDNETSARVDRLFARFMALYGERWARPLRDERVEAMAREEWAPAVQALTDDQVRQGIEGCKASMREWPPSFGEFVRLALGLPEPAEAAIRAAKGDPDDLSRVIRQRAGGSHAVAVTDRGDRICERAYHEVVRDLVQQVSRGHPVEPAQALPAMRTDRTRVTHTGTRAGEVVSVGDAIRVPSTTEQEA